MQHILTEQELNRGCELIKAWVTDDMSLDDAYIEQENLNNQGFFTVIHCSDFDKEQYKIAVFQRK